MVKSRLLLAGTLVIAGACRDAVGPDPDPSFGIRQIGGHRADTLRADPESEGHYIVVFRSGVANPDGLTNQLLGTYGGRAVRRYRAVLTGFAGTLPAKALDGIRHHPDVELVEVDAQARATGVQSNPPSWGLDRIDMRDLPLDGHYDEQNGGAGVRAYILDTGVEITHPEYASRLAPGWDIIDNDAEPSDCYGHGTLVAGTVAGTTVGVAKQATVVPVRVMDCQGVGQYSQIIAGLEWVVANHVKPAVINMSLGGPASAVLNTAVDNTVAAGVVVVVAAGNENSNACYYSPSSAASALTVGATADNDARAWYSNTGTCLDLFAPGSLIRTSGKGASYVTSSGTSLSSPHVAGVAALYLASHPGAGPMAVTDAILNGATADLVTDARPGSPNRLLYSGILNHQPPPSNAAPSARFSVSCVGRTCTFSDLSTDPNSDIAAWQWGFGDGQNSASQNPTHTYASAGSFVVTLQVTDSTGAWGVTSQTVVVTDPAPVNLPPTAGFASACVRLSCQFTDSSQDPDGTLSQWEWSFGDGASLITAASAGQSHVFTEGAMYRVRLTVTDNQGATSTVSQDVSVGVVLSGTSHKLKGRVVIELSWVGAESATVTIVVNGSTVATVPNSGSHTYRPSARGQGSTRYKVCEAGVAGATCSREIVL